MMQFGRDAWADPDKIVRSANYVQQEVGGRGRGGCAACLPACLPAPAPRAARRCSSHAPTARHRACPRPPPRCQRQHPPRLSCPPGGAPGPALACLCQPLSLPISAGATDLPTPPPKHPQARPTPPRLLAAAASQAAGAAAAGPAAAALHRGDQPPHKARLPGLLQRLRDAAQVARRQVPGRQPRLLHAAQAAGGRARWVGGRGCSLEGDRAGAAGSALVEAQILAPALPPA
jgi:hypothetical protein